VYVTSVGHTHMHAHCPYANRLYAIWNMLLCSSLGKNHITW